MSFQFLEQDKPIYSKGQKDKKTIWYFQSLWRDD